MGEDMLGAYGGNFLIAVIGVGVALALLVLALWLIKGRNGPSPFVRGGKNRQPRLQVLDAAAVDTRRRLVLIRRDNVEHLVMIGGPTDIVIESGIGAATAPFVAPIQTEMPRPAPRVASPQPTAEPERRATPPRETLVAAATEPVVAQKIEPAIRPTRDIKPEPQSPVVSASTGPSVDQAATLLDAARERVFNEPAAEPRPASVKPAEPAVSIQAAVEKPKQMGSDFERILQQEMENNLAAQNAAIVNVEPTAPVRQLPQRDPNTPRVTGATPEPSLQDEVAKIFGEMSVTRDK